MGSEYVFKAYLGASRIEFLVVFEDNKYKGKVNNITIYESTNYEIVREALLKGMWDEKKRIH